MINIGLRSEYSFRQTYGRVKDLVAMAAKDKKTHLGIADLNNTFAHVYLEKECKKNNITPIFGVRLEVVKGALDKVRGRAGPIYIFIAKNKEGFQEINYLTELAYKRFYYKPMLDYTDMKRVSDNVFVIAENLEGLDRVDYIALTPSTSRMLLDVDIPKVYVNDNFYKTAEDRPIYQIIAGAQKRGDDYYYKFNSKTCPQHILDIDEFDFIWGCPDAGENTLRIAEHCDVTIPRASMVKYLGDWNLEKMCMANAKLKGINLNSGVYADRYQREIQIIREKDFDDYFMIVAEMVIKSKNKMLVGPARGSSAGSLVCYLLGITEVDPIEFDLLFERFIDINRHDLPDIDVDFPDVDRQAVVKDLFKIHGQNNVCHISNVNLFKAKSAIGDVGMALKIPIFEVETLKDSIVDRSGGDARAAMSVKDTLETTQAGKDFMEQYPSMKYAADIQGHATHAGKHAAGIIVCNDEITNFGGVNHRENSIMMDKKGAEYLNLLKIDVLGLRTLSILQDAAILAGKDRLFYYDLPRDDQKTFKIFNEMRLYGIFQFEGQAMRMLCQSMGIEHFDDIVAVTALARPGPLHSGGANTYVDRRTGRKPTDYISNNPIYVERTKETYGVIIYQEQLMFLCRELGNMSWEDVSQIRKAASKTMGKEFFDQYREKFVTGCGENDVNSLEANEIWENIMTFGSWGMNKSHTVSYGMISYWCAYMKANYPLEFTVANLKHAKSSDSALKILRDAVENEGLEYDPVDPDVSELEWSVQNGRLVGGLLNIEGIGAAKAKEIIACRDGKKKWTLGLIKKLTDPITPYDELYPCRALWGDIYENPQDYGLAYCPHFIDEIQDGGTYVAIGKVTRRDLRDLNEYNEVVKRGGKIYHENNKSLKLTIEDDTGQINCSINRFKFDKLKGKHFAEVLVEDESWVIIKGKVKDGWRIIDIENIFDLKELTA